MTLSGGADVDPCEAVMMCGEEDRIDHYICFKTNSIGAVRRLSTFEPFNEATSIYSFYFCPIAALTKQLSVMGQWRRRRIYRSPFDPINLDSKAYNDEVRAGGNSCIAGVLSRPFSS